MRASLAAVCLLLILSCSSTKPPEPVVAGALAIQINPNPILAQKVAGETYDFPFELIVREVGGAAVTIDRVSIAVNAFGGLPLYAQHMDQAEIQRRGFVGSVESGSEVRYRFNPRKEVPDERLFSAVSADLTVEGTDTGGRQTRARTTVTVRR